MSTATPPRTAPAHSTELDFDAVIVGAGFAGMYMLHRLRGLGLRVRVIEGGDDVGGTWYWNRYPGARCDIESMEYSYQFSDELQQEWEWSERYAAQPEILRYIDHVAERFDLRRDIEFETWVTAAHFDEIAGRWTIQTDRGRFTAQFCIMATGCLSSRNTPDFPGLDRFEGEWYHTGSWPHAGVDFAGKRVGVIGTGSSAIQSIPHIAREAEHLTVFQRTATFSVPAHNRALDPESVRATKAEYAAFRARNAQMPFGANFPLNPVSAHEPDASALNRVFEDRWRVGGLGFIAAFSDLLFDLDANAHAAKFVHGKIRETVKNPAVADLLCPDQVVGCKRLCVDTDYYETFNRPNVRLVDVSSHPIEEITPKGLRANGIEYELDLIVFATGFDAMTGSLLKIDITGRGGLSLRDKWAAGPRTYLGLGTSGFPNLFTITGPGSPSVLSNMIPAIEQHVDWIADCVAYMAAKQQRCIEAEADAEAAWIEHVNQVANRTVYPSCNSWYLGANVPGKPRVFMPYIGFPAYVAKCQDVAAKGYEGFSLSG